MHWFGGGIPVIESSRDANGDGRGMGKCKLYRDEQGLSTLGVIVIFIVFHNWSRPRRIVPHFPAVLWRIAPGLVL